MSASKISIPKYCDNSIYCSVSVSFLLLHLSIGFWSSTVNMKSTCLKIDNKQNMSLPKQQQIVVNCTLSAYHFSYKFNKRWTKILIEQCCWFLSVGSENYFFLNLYRETDKNRLMLIYCSPIYSQQSTCRLCNYAKKWILKVKSLSIRSYHATTSMLLITSF